MVDAIIFVAMSHRVGHARVKLSLYKTIGGYECDWEFDTDGLSQILTPLLFQLTI
jgi:hypothetical protein